jgi:hypothetical protein
METLREVAPFLVGFALPLVMLTIHRSWPGRLKFAGVFIPSLVLGIMTSLFAGELLAGLPDGLIAVVIDTALVFTGSQLAYRLFWKNAVEARLQPDEPVSAPQRVRREGR